VTILRNERYIGNWTWNKTKVVRHHLDGSTKKIARPQDEWHTEKREDLRIIPQDLWDSVNGRLGIATKPFPKRKSINNTQSTDSSNPSYIHAYPRDPFDGLSRCGICGNAIMKVSGKSGGYLGCHHATIGACTNKVLVRKTIADKEIFEYLIRQVLKPEAVEMTLKEVERLVKNYRGDIPEKLRETSRELDQVNARIRSYVTFVEQGNSSRTIGELLKAAEGEEDNLKKQKSALEHAKSKVFESPPIEWIEHRLKNLKDVLYKNPHQSALVVRKLLGELIFHPVYPDIGKPYYKICSTVQALALTGEKPDAGSNSMEWWS
jgi:site-specific DNA recombinase